MRGGVICNPSNRGKPPSKANAQCGVRQIRTVERPPPFDNATKPNFKPQAFEGNLNFSALS